MQLEQFQGSECFTALNHWQQELSSRLKLVDEARCEIADAVLAIQKLVATGAEQEKFLLQENVPVMTGRLPRSRETEYSALKALKQQPEKAGATGKLMEDWSESFVVNEAEATMMYNWLYGQRRSRRNATVSVFSDPLMVESPEDSTKWWWQLFSWLDLIWNIMTLVLVAIDTIFLPVSLAWPSLVQTGSFWFFYYEATPYFWMMDIVLAITLALTDKNDCRSRFRSYMCQAFPRDASVVLVDIFLISGLVDEDFRLFTMLRLLRALKFRAVMSMFENRLATRGNMVLVYWSTILQSVMSILVVNHSLACAMFYIGRMGKLWGQPNWIETYEVENQSDAMQYMTSFNLLIAQDTPAPFRYRAQNEIEQAAILVIILTCLPLLGAQIAKITGTLNLMNEKAKERDHVKRDLQRWLHKTKVPSQLNQRMLASLEDVLNSDESPLEVKDPMALRFLPSTLLDELRVVKTGQRLASHPLYKMLMDARLSAAGNLVAAFHSEACVMGEPLFKCGDRAEGMFVTVSGSFLLKTPQDESDVALEESGNNSQIRSKSLISALSEMTDVREGFVAELSLFTELSHSSLFTSVTYAKVLKTTAKDFLKAMHNSPAALVAIHEYAVELLRQAKRKGKIKDRWELLEDHCIEDSVRITQLSELLTPGSGKMHDLKGMEVSNISDFVEQTLQSPLPSPEEFQLGLKEAFSELNEYLGIYAQLNHQEEAKRAILSILSAMWLLKDDYEQMVACQKGEAKLSRSTWTAIQELVCADFTEPQLAALVVLLGLRGLSKNSEFAKLCPPSERRSPETVLSYAVNELQMYLPSLASLPPEGSNYVASTVRMLGQFSFPQFLQAENNPHSVWMLQSVMKVEDPVIFKMFLLTQVCVLCGVTGAVTVKGSLFLNEMNGRSVLKTLQCLQSILASDGSGPKPSAQAVYWNYMVERAEALQLKVQQPGHLALARLACLTRAVEPNQLRSIQKDWNSLSDRQRDALYEIFLLDGHLQKAFLFQYLPLFLSNAVSNTDLGLKNALVFLVELYETLLNHRCLTHFTGSTVNVDIFSLAGVATEVEDLRMLRQCLERARIVKHLNGVTVLLTKESYQIISGQLVDHRRESEILESLREQQMRMERSLQRSKQNVMAYIF